MYLFIDNLIIGYVLAYISDSGQSFLLYVQKAKIASTRILIIYLFRVKKRIFFLISENKRFKDGKYLHIYYTFYLFRVKFDNLAYKY